MELGNVVLRGAIRPAAHPTSLFGPTFRPSYTARDSPYSSDPKGSALFQFSLVAATLQIRDSELGERRPGNFCLSGHGCASQGSQVAAVTDGRCRRTQQERAERL